MEYITEGMKIYVFQQTVVVPRKIFKGSRESAVGLRICWRVVYFFLAGGSTGTKDNLNSSRYV
jgi:hypothetical protein